MSDKSDYQLIDDIKCFHHDIANDYADYPKDGFELTAKIEKVNFWVSSRNRLFKKLVKLNMLGKGNTRLLEIGCATGEFIHQIKDFPKLEITGSEIYLSGLRYAKKKLPDINFIQFDITRGVVDQCYDLIIAFDVLEHIENDTLALTNINKMLDKEGIFIVSVPQHMFLWSNLDNIVRHKRRYSRKELLTKLCDNRFEILYTTSFVFILFPLMLITRLRDKNNNKNTQSDEIALAQRVKFPNVLNWILDLLMRIDEFLIHCRASLPFGGTLIVIAKKNKNITNSIGNLK